jgi:D-serine deaminase-like pyridoxal phosphate-dependent protein
MNDIGSPVGLPKTALDTPALLVDLDVLDANIARVASACRQHGVGWRPHLKGHKTLEIARKELAAGAVGITAAKLGEVEVMAAGGIVGVLIANQIVGPQKIRRLMELPADANPIVAVDSMANAAELADAAAGRGRVAQVVIEVDIGMKRAGVAPGAAVVALAKAIAERPSLRFRGLIGWEAHAVTIADPGEKERTVAAAIGLLTASATACRQAGHAVDIVSCGGTGSFPYCAMQPGVTDVQVGGAIFSDMHYRTHYHADFPCALTLIATVTSRPTATRIVVDAGKKSMSGDAAMPLPIDLPAVRGLRLSAEHATIELEAPSERPRIGDRLEFIVGYSDTTVHLHEEVVGIRQGSVECIWPIAARGRLK